MKLTQRDEWPNWVVEFEYLGRQFEVWNNNCYFAIQNMTTGREYCSATWFRIKEMDRLYAEAVVLLATVNP